MASPGVKTSATPAAPPEAAPTPAAFGAATFPLVAALGYTAFLISGFGTDLGLWRPIPLYAFFGFLLFLLLENLVQARSTAQIAYIAFATVFALLYAADVGFNKAGWWHFSRAPLTYVIINFLLFAVLVIDAIRRRPDLAQSMGLGSQASARAEADAAPLRRHPLSPATLATDFAELAILSYVAATLVNLLKASTPPYVVIDLNQTLNLHLPARIQHLQDFDSAVALAATAVALLFLGIVSGLPAESDGAGAGSRIVSFRTALGRIFRTSLREVLFSLQLVLGPLVFVSVGLSLAALAKEITRFFQAAQTSTDVFDLLNPFSPTSTARYDLGLTTLLIVGIAIVSFVISVAIVEHDAQIIRRTFRLIGAAGQTAALSLAFFLFSLAFLNAVLVFIGVTRVEPFQASAFALLALLVGGAFAAFPAVRQGTGEKTT